MSSRTKKLYYSGPNNGKSFTTLAPISLWRGAVFIFGAEINRPQKHKKRAILLAFKANGGVEGSSPPPSYTRPIAGHVVASLDMTLYDYICFVALKGRTSTKLSGQEFKIHRSIGSLETPKQGRIPPSTM